MKWSEKEIDYLKDNYSNLEISIDDMAEELGRTHDVVRKKANKLGFHKIELKKWTKDEVQYLKENYENLNISLKSMSEQLNREPSSIYSKAINFGFIRKKKKWTKEDIQYLKNNYSNLSISIDDMAKELDRDNQSIRAKASKLNLKRIDNVEFYNSHRNEKWLRHQYDDLGRTVKSIAEESGIKERSLHAFMQRNGIETADSKFKYREIDEKRICDLYVDEEYSVEEIADIMKIGVYTIQNRLVKNGVSIRIGVGTKTQRVKDKMSIIMKNLYKEEPERFVSSYTWTKEDVEFLRKNFPNRKIKKEIFEKRLNRKWGTITSKAFFEGIKRPKLKVDVNGHSLHKYALAARLRSIFCGDEWRKSVYKKDNYKCVECGSDEKLYAHHIETVSEIIERIDLSLTFDEIKEFIKEDGKMSDLENTKTLCFDCHCICHPHLKGLMLKQAKNKEIVNV